MNSKKNDTSNLDDDLKFMPLNLKEPFKSKDSSWAPYINLDIPTNYMTNNFFLPLPELQLTQGFNNPSNLNAMSQLDPYYSNFSKPSPYQSNNNVENMNSNLNKNNTTYEGELYPSETLEDELYSYNTNNINNPNNSTNNSTNRDINNLIHLDILRDFDLSLDSDIKSDNRLDSDETIDKIFEDIKSNNNGLIETLNSYKIPYPISTLVIKKIVRSTINHCKEV